MLSAALIYGIVATLAGVLLTRWWVEAEHDAESMRGERDRHRDDAKAANDRKWELIARSNEALAQLQESKRTVAKLADERDETISHLRAANRDLESLRGFLAIVKTERDEAIREQAKWKEAAEYAVNNLREIDRMLSEHMKPVPTADIPF